MRYGRHPERMDLTAALQESLFWIRASFHGKYPTRNGWYVRGSFGIIGRMVKPEEVTVVVLQE